MEQTSQPQKNPGSGIRVYPTQTQTQYFGDLRIQCRSLGEVPIENATITITLPGEPDSVVDQITTDASGLAPVVELNAPPFNLSQEPNAEQPYANYDVRVSAPNFEGAVFSDIEILPNVTATQNIRLNPSELAKVPEESFVIYPHTLYAEYPPKIPEDEIKPTAQTGEIVLSRVVVPEFVIVHDGPPESPATNHYVGFRDYIKNVASSEIYATWPEESIYANVFAILSFTLNRVYTEWYRGQGFNFTITSSTAYDHKWINGRNIFTNIGIIVDTIFTNYLSRPNVTQPILTQYCDGNRVQCPGWMTQWGSKYLGDQKYTPIEILRYFYGESIYINTAVGVSGVPVSWPGFNLGIGASGDNVRTLQNQLNRIAEVYTAIPKVAADGTYSAQTADAVREFQRIFDLPVTGVVDQPTWYRISNIYVGVTRIGE